MNKYESRGIGKFIILLLCGTGTKLKLLLNLINPVLKILLKIFRWFTWVDWRVIPNFVALVVVFPEIVEVLRFVSLVFVLPGVRRRMLR